MTNVNTDKILDLVLKSKFKYDDCIKNKDIYEKSSEIIQTGIGDILLNILLIRNNIKKIPLYFNLNIYINNVIVINNPLNSFKFKLSLLNKICETNDIVFYNDNINDYSCEYKLNEITNFKALHTYFTFDTKFDKEYIIFHTKCRFQGEFDYNNLKLEIIKFAKNFKTNYLIVILGERIMPSNFETDYHKITTVYNELLNLKHNNNVLDLSIDNIYDNLIFDNYCKDMSIIYNAKTNIIFGHGGQYCNSIVFGNGMIVYTNKELCLNFNLNLFENNNNYLLFNINTFFDKIINNYSIIKQDSAFFLGHNGLGDNISNIGALNFLSHYYNTIYFLCKDIYYENITKLFQTKIINKNIILKQFNSLNEFDECNTIITNAMLNSISNDIFISGVCHTSYLKSRITHPQLLQYKQNDNEYTIKWNHIRSFYYDICLDLSIYYDYFKIDSCQKSKEYFEMIKNYNIIFLHTKASNKEISLNDIIDKYINKEDTIIICVNKNVYENNNNTKYELADKYINILLAYYIDIIHNALEIHVINSCFSCIINPLTVTNKLCAKIINIYDR